MASLQRFRLNGIRNTGRKVGDGAYATVLEYDYGGQTCVGKKIHPVLYEVASEAERAHLLQRFEKECQLLSRLYHPKIVGFIGVHFEPTSVLPVLVMEYLPTGNLSGYLDKHGTLPDDISYGILRDVALGLRYLHEQTPPIIHRDLSANNVLLTTSLSAKISDLGVAKILNRSSSHMTQHMSTKAPGTSCYMPPEALTDRPNYTIKIDSYSFGVLMLHVFCGEWPFPTAPFQPNPNHEGRILPVTEVDRRAEYFEKMGRGHPLSDLIQQCLSNWAHKRPETSNLLWEINTVMKRIVAPPETVIHHLEHFRREIQRLSRDIQSLKRQNENLTGEIQELDEENENLAKSEKSLREEVMVLRRDSQSLREEVRRLREKNEGWREECKVVRRDYQSLEDEVRNWREYYKCLKKQNQKHNERDSKTGWCEAVLGLVLIFSFSIFIGYIIFHIVTYIIRLLW